MLEWCKKGGGGQEKGICINFKWGNSYVYYCRYTGPSQGCYVGYRANMVGLLLINRKAVTMFYQLFTQITMIVVNNMKLFWFSSNQMLNQKT